MSKRGDVSIITIFFERKNFDERIKIKTISTETLEFVLSLFRIKAKEKDVPLKFFFKGKQIDPKLSLVDAGISDNSIITTRIENLDFGIPGPYIILNFVINKTLNYYRTFNEISIKANLNELLEDVIDRLKNKYRFLDKNMEFIYIYNALRLILSLPVAQTGLINNSKIYIIDAEAVKGAGGGFIWHFQEINIKFIKISKSINTNINILNLETIGLLKLCLLKELSSKFRFYFFGDNYKKLKKNLPDLIICILQILIEGYISSDGDDDIKETIIEVIQKEGGGNIINFSKFVDKVVNQNHIAQIMKLLNPNDFKEINEIRFLLSKYNEHIVLFNKDFERAKKESIFEFSIISMVIIERQDYEKFEKERKKCPNRVDKILFHGTSVEPISCILTGLFKKSIDRCCQHGNGVYFTDFLIIVGFMEAKPVIEQIKIKFLD